MKLRNLSALLGAIALTFSAATTVLATAPTGHQVTICHATDSFSHPYVIETVDIGSTGHLRGGHDTQHTGPVFDGSAKHWGDIIPPYTYLSFVYPGQNYVGDGLAIYNAGCTIPGEAPHNPLIHVEKTPSTATLPAGGGAVTYTYVVTNTGDVPLSNVTVSDDKCATVTFASGDTNDDGLLDLTESWSFACTTTLTGTTTNTATATGHFGETTVTDTDVATVTVAASAPAIHVVKTPSVVTLPVGGGNVTYTYVVTNTGNIALSNVSVSDDKCSPVGFASGDTNSNSKLDLTESWTFTCTTHLATTTTNTATATGHSGNSTVTDTDQATVTVAPPANPPAISIEKTASATTLPVGGGSVTYTYAVTNAGNVALSSVTVSDDKCTPVGFVSGDTNGNSLLDLTETWTFSCTTTITATTTNTATAIGHSGDATVTDTDQATVTVTPPGGGVGGETNVPVVPTAPSTDTLASGTAGDASGTLPLLLIVLGAIGLGAVLLTPTRKRH